MLVLEMRLILGEPLSIENGLKLLLTAGLFAWNVLEGAVFENTYPLPLVRLYVVPIWRVLLIVAMFLSVEWCYSFAFMLVFAIFFYIMDLEVTSDKWGQTDLKRTGN